MYAVTHTSQHPLYVNTNTTLQGPPGTGKTRVVLGILAAVLAGSLGSGANAPPDKIPPQRVLIVAPSNAAADELAARVLNGVLGPDGAQRLPRVVRVGARRADAEQDSGGDGRAGGMWPSTAPSSMSEVSSGVPIRTALKLLRPKTHAAWLNAPLLVSSYSSTRVSFLFRCIADQFVGISGRATIIHGATKY